MQIRIIALSLGFFMNCSLLQSALPNPFHTYVKRVSNEQLLVTFPFLSQIQELVVPMHQTITQYQVEAKHSQSRCLRLIVTIVQAEKYIAITFRKQDHNSFCKVVFPLPRPEESCPQELQR